MIVDDNRRGKEYPEGRDINPVVPQGAPVQTAETASEEMAEQEDKGEDDLNLERLIELTNELDIVAPQSTQLTKEDRQDLALFDRLTQAQAQIEQVKAVEAEIVDRETWNYDAAIQLGTLATTL